MGKILAETIVTSGGYHENSIRLPEIRQYTEEEPVFLRCENGRVTVVACNEGGYETTSIDLKDLLHWVVLNPRILFWHGKR